MKPHNISNSNMEKDVGLVLDTHHNMHIGTYQLPSIKLRCYLQLMNESFQFDAIC